MTYFLLGLLLGATIALQIAEWIFEESGPLAYKWIGASVGKPISVEVLNSMPMRRLSVDDRFDIPPDPPDPEGRGTPPEKEVAIPVEALDSGP